MPRTNPRNPFLRTLNMAAFTTTDLTINTLMQELGRVTVVAGQGIAVGYGGFEGQHASVGRWYADINDNGAADEDGMLRLTANDPQNRVRRTLMEVRTETLRNATAADRSTHLPMPFINFILPEDWSLVLWMDGDVNAAVVDVSACLLFLDVTEFEMW